MENGDDMVKVKIDKENQPTTTDFGRSNAKFYGWFSVNGKREGTVWCFPDYYVANEDFDRKRHFRDNRPKQFNGANLKELASVIETEFGVM